MFGYVNTHFNPPDRNPAIELLLFISSYLTGYGT